LGARLEALLWYAATLALELPGALVRFAVVYLVALPVLILRGSVPFEYPIALIAALFPMAWSALALILPATGRWLWQARMGGRSPSERERRAYEDAVHILAQTGYDLPLPSHWLVIDDEAPRAAALGDSLMLSRGDLHDGQLAAVLAHELGHLATSDGRVTAALDRLVLWHDPLGPNPYGGLRPFRAAVRGLLYLAGGGASLLITRGIWGTWWRERELQADHYTAALGQGPALATYLEQQALPHDTPTPFIWLTDKSHPYTEHRIERLRKTSDSYRPPPDKLQGPAVKLAESPPTPD